MADNSIADRLGKLHKATGFTEDDAPTPEQLDEALTKAQREWREDEHRPIGETGSVATPVPTGRAYIERVVSPWDTFPSPRR